MDNAKDKLVGQAKEAFGEATNNEELANEGRGQKTAGEAKQKASEAVDNVQDKANEALGSLTDDK